MAKATGKKLELVDSLAVRTRPKQFSDIVGNSSNIKTIRGFLLKGQLPRTWLFSGDPGSGKTTSARLLSMTVNCENIGKNIKQGVVEPCLECTSCKLALQSKHPDIIEINSGGEEGNAQGIRDLISSMKLAPRFNVKCFVVDECLPLDTEILATNGEYITIEEMLRNPGFEYEVLSHNVDTGQDEPDVVERVWETGQKEMTEITLADGSRWRSSLNHKWWSESHREYIRADELQAGEKLHGRIGDEYIRNVSKLDGTERCANLTVKRNHNFYIRIGKRDILVSNCHLLSATAKSNLLKPLEEPPSHVLWALCTTDPDKLPKAALTRCVKLYYEYPPLTDAAKKLWKVAKSEYTSEVSSKLKPFIKQIVQNTSGQMRDSYSLLESMASIVYADPDIDDDTLHEEFATALTSLGELSVPAIRFITHAMSNKFTLPLGIISEIDQSRFVEFLTTVAKHAHYASLYILHKHEGTQREFNKRKFYSVNSIRFDKALDTLLENLNRKYSFEQIQYKIVSLCGGVLEAINKNRQGLLSPEQSIFCAINTYMRDAYLSKGEE